MPNAEYFQLQERLLTERIERSIGDLANELRARGEHPDRAATLAKQHANRLTHDDEGRPVLAIEKTGGRYLGENAIRQLATEIRVAERLSEVDREAMIAEKNRFGDYRV